MSGPKFGYDGAPVIVVSFQGGHIFDQRAVSKRKTGLGENFLLIGLSQK